MGKGGRKREKGATDKREKKGKQARKEEGERGVVGENKVMREQRREGAGN